MAKPLASFILELQYVNPKYAEATTTAILAMIITTSTPTAALPDNPAKLKDDGLGEG